VRGHRSAVYQRRFRYPGFVPFDTTTAISAKRQSNGFIHDEVTVHHKDTEVKEKKSEVTFSRRLCIPW